MASVFMRGDVFYTKFRTPKKYRRVEDRAHVVVSLKTGSRSEALELAVVARAEREIFWARKLGEDPSLLARRVAALAERMGFDYRTSKEVAAMDMADVIARVMALPRGAGPRSETTLALLGGVPRQKLRVSGLVDAYENALEIEKGPKTGEQLRVWRSARRRAARSFIEAVGDLAIEEIARDDVLRWRKALRVAMKVGRWGSKKPIKLESAKKELVYMSAMVTRMLDELHLPNNFPFARIWMHDPNARKEKGGNIRPPIPEELIRTILFDPVKMSGLDAQARDALLVLVNTGARPSEVIGLLPHHIHLDDPVPHISIREESRQLKTDASVRDIPLVSVSLEAMRRRPEGFPRWRGRVTAWGGRVNRHLRDV